MGMLFLVTYVFLLRLPSEALPIVRSGSGLADNGVEQAQIYMEDNTLFLKLAQRKNKPDGSLLRRECWCNDCKFTCPIYVLWAYFEKLDLGCRPFFGITPACALGTLREMLLTLKIVDAIMYRTHDLRRGHAADIQQNGGTIQEILTAGEWKPGSHLAYLDRESVEAGAVNEAHLQLIVAESSSDEEEDEMCMW